MDQSLETPWLLTPLNVVQQLGIAAPSKPSLIGKEVIIPQSVVAFAFNPEEYEFPSLDQIL